MSRPLIQLGIMELEALFAKSRRDTQVLRNLEAELEHRQVPRARSLLASVRTAMKATDATVSPAALGPAVADRASDMLNQPELGLFNPLPSAPPKVTPPAPIASKQASQPIEEGTVIPLSEAYRLLKANLGSSWESIEMVRRQLVQRASPAVVPTEQQLRLQEEANRINAAYKAIVVARVQGVR
jgi:hypothetical protein